MHSQQKSTQNHEEIMVYTPPATNKRMTDEELRDFILNNTAFFDNLNWPQYQEKFKLPVDFCKWRREQIEQKINVSISEATADALCDVDIRELIRDNVKQR